MAEFRLKIGLIVGSGTITVNGVAPVTYYEEGTTLNISVTLDPGWLSIEWFAGGDIFLSDDLSFSVTMPSRDYLIRGVASGDAQPIDGFGLMFFSEFKSMNNENDLRLEIYEDGFGGDPTEVKCKDVFINFGDNEKNLTETILGTSLDFTLAGEAGDYDLFLTGDVRTFRVILKKDLAVIFDGYLTPDFIEFNDLSGLQLFSFVAIDGLKSLEAYRIDPFVFPGGTGGIRNTGLTAILGALNQTFIEQRPINIICNIYEDRMSDSDSLFNQFLWPESSIFTDGERVKFVDGNIIYNETNTIKEALESILRPFLCRVFLWENEFWVVRIPDMLDLSMNGFRYLSNSDFDDEITVNNSLEICKLNPLPRIRTGRVYSEFTALLNLGVLQLSAQGAVFESKFDIDSWFFGSPASVYAGIWVLRPIWSYVRSTPGSQPGSPPSGELAFVQYASDLSSESCKIWTTTTTAGLSDSNLSSIVLTTESGFFVADELVNKLSVELEYAVVPVRSGLTNTFNNHSVAIQVRIGSYYLRLSSTPDIYEFTTTPAHCVFPVPNQNTFNKIKITNVVLPVSGFVEVSLYQLILNSGTRHQFAILYRNFKLNIEENDAFVLSQIGAKGVTTQKYSSIFKDYETNIGDARSAMSTSAIRLNITDNPVSESWTAKDFTSLPLLGGIVQDLANLYGRSNRILKGTAYNVAMKPYQSFQYDGNLFVLLNFKWNIQRDSFDFEAFDLGPIPTT
jgi:hypothetical protein